MDGFKNVKIYNDIFEACRHIAPTSILLSLDAEEFQPFKSSNSYRLIRMPDGSTVALPNPMA